MYHSVLKEKYRERMKRVTQSGGGESTLKYFVVFKGDVFSGLLPGFMWGVKCMSREKREKNNIFSTSLTYMLVPLFYTFKQAAGRKE